MSSITITSSNAAISVQSGCDVFLGVNANNDTITLAGNDTLHGALDSNPNTVNASGNNTINVIVANIIETGGNDNVNARGVSTINTPYPNTIYINVNDVANGGLGNNTIYGGNGTVGDSGSGNDKIYAQALGSHIIDFGTGNDTIVARDGTNGTPGHYEFIDVFDFTSGKDVIALNAAVGAHLDNAANIGNIMTHVTTVGGNATLYLGGLIITFEQVSASALHASDFILV